MGRSRYTIREESKPHFLTCSIIHWLPLFSKPAIAKIVIDTLNFMQENKRINLFAFVIMENHIHLIASSPNLKSEISKFKSYSARSGIDWLVKKNNHVVLTELNLHKIRHKKDREYQFWQEGAHPQLIQNEEMMRQKIEYIHNNPVVRGYVDKPEHWRYSSARNYLGLPGMIEISKWV